jgi:predicted DNA-binding transcriptional regulator AlpA
MTRVIDLASEQPISLAQAAKVLGRSHPTIYRYSTSGVRGVQLETVRLGKQRLTCMAAIQRFLDRLSE